MTASLEIEFLGTGTSTGVPVIGCNCAVCKSDNPRNKRLRSSVVVRCGGTTVLVDSSPDLRQQALRSGLTAIDAIVYTHIHLDHVTGFDDLRAFCWHSDKKLPFYCGPGTLEGLKGMFGWAFQESNTYQGYVRPDPRVVTAPFRIGELMITPVPVIHGGVEMNGYVFESPDGKRAGYIPDVKEVPEASLALLKGLDVLIMDSLMHRLHPTHSSTGETLEVFQKAEVKRGYFTHMSHDIEFEEESARVPGNVRLAYDGLKINLAEEW